MPDKKPATKDRGFNWIYMGSPTNAIDHLTGVTHIESSKWHKCNWRVSTGGYWNA